jgi:hypothetical protein
MPACAGMTGQEVRECCAKLSTASVKAGSQAMTSDKPRQAQSLMAEERPFARLEA